MDKAQAEAIANALLGPDMKAQEAARQRYRARELGRMRSRKVAWFAAAGALVGAIGVAIAGGRFFDGVVWGAPVGAIVGWLVVRLER